MSAVFFVVRATVHTTVQATPSQLVFEKNHILNIKYEANWKYIRDQTHKVFDKNNKRENHKRNLYDYAVGQKVLVQEKQSRKYGKNPYTGPYEITALHKNGSVRLRSLLGQGAVYQTYNIRNLSPFSE